MHFTLNWEWILCNASFIINFVGVRVILREVENEKSMVIFIFIFDRCMYVCNIIHIYSWCWCESVKKKSTTFTMSIYSWFCAIMLPSIQRTKSSVDGRLIQVWSRRDDNEGWVVHKNETKRGSQYWNICSWRFFPSRLWKMMRQYLFSIAYFVNV